MLMMLKLDAAVDCDMYYISRLRAISINPLRMSVHS